MGSSVWINGVPVELEDFQISWVEATMRERATLYLPERSVVFTIGGHTEQQIARVFRLHPRGGTRSGHRHRGTRAWARRYARRVGL